MHWRGVDFNIHYADTMTRLRIRSLEGEKKMIFPCSSPSKPRHHHIEACARGQYFLHHRLPVHGIRCARKHWLLPERHNPPNSMTCAHHGRIVPILPQQCIFSRYWFLPLSSLPLLLPIPLVLILLLLGFFFPWKLVDSLITCTY